MHDHQFMPFRLRGSTGLCLKGGGGLGGEGGYAYRWGLYHHFERGFIPQSGNENHKINGNETWG